MGGAIYSVESGGTVSRYRTALDDTHRCITSGERPSPTALSGILIGLLGAVMLIGWTAGNATAANLTGAAVVLVAAALWAIGSIYGKTAKLPASSLLTTGIQMLAGGSVLLVVAFLAGDFVEFDIGAVTSRSALAWAYLTVIGTGAFSPTRGSCASRRRQFLGGDVLVCQSAGSNFTRLFYRKRADYPAHSLCRWIDHRFGAAGKPRAEAAQNDLAINFASGPRESR